MRAAPAELESIITAIEHLPVAHGDSAGPHSRARARAADHPRAARPAVRRDMPEVAARSTTIVAGFQDPADATRFDRLDELINAQAYRLSSWRVAGEEINYRRFFDVNTLAAIRMELPEVFDATHRLLFELIEAGHVTGVRIDHIDGLAYPAGVSAAGFASAAGDALYLLVEKILGPDEKLRADWPVQGTTGYEFANQLVQLLVSAQRRAAACRELRPVSRLSARLPRGRLSQQEARHADLDGERGERSRPPAQPPLGEPSLVSRFHAECPHRPPCAKSSPASPCTAPTSTPRSRRTNPTRASSTARSALARRRNPAMERTVFEFPARCAAAAEGQPASGR